MAPTTGPKETKSLEAILKNRPDSLLFARLADAYRKDGNISRAIELCINGLNNYPYYTTGRLLLGRCYLEQQKYSEAIEAFTMVCTGDRRNQMAIKMLADIFVKQGMEQRAGGLYALLLQMDPVNKTLSHLCAKFGTIPGDDDLFTILGIQQTTTRMPSTGHMSATDTPLADNLEPVVSQDFPEQTIIEDRDTMFPAADTMSPFSAGVNVDESYPATDVSGGDIADRMSALFGEQQMVETSETAATMLPDDAPAQNFLSDALMPVSGTSDSMEVSGSDISERIGQLFSGDSQQSHQDIPAAISATTEPSQTEELSTDSLLTSQDFDLSGLSLGDEPATSDVSIDERMHFDNSLSTAPDPSFFNSPVAPVAEGVIELVNPDSLLTPEIETSPENGDLSGADVSNRLEEIFSGSDAELPADSVTSAIPTVPDDDFSSEQPLEFPGFDFSPDNLRDVPETMPEEASEPDLDLSIESTVTDFDVEPEAVDPAGPEADPAAIDRSTGSYEADFQNDVQNADAVFTRNNNYESIDPLQPALDETDHSGMVSGTDISNRIDNLFDTMPPVFTTETQRGDALATNDSIGDISDSLDARLDSADSLSDALSVPPMQPVDELYPPAQLSPESAATASNEQVFEPDFSESEFAETMQFDSALFEQMLNPVEPEPTTSDQSPPNTGMHAETVETMPALNESALDEDMGHFTAASTGHDPFEDTRGRRIELDHDELTEDTGFDRIIEPTLDKDDFQLTTERYRFDGPELIVDNDSVTPRPSDGTATFEIFKPAGNHDEPELIIDAPVESGALNFADLLTDTPVTDRMVSDHTEIVELAPNGEDIAGQIDLLFPSDGAAAVFPGAPEHEIDVPDDLHIEDILIDAPDGAAESEETDAAYIETMQMPREELAAAIARENAAGSKSDEEEADRVLSTDDSPASSVNDDLIDGTPISGSDVCDRLDDIFPGSDLFSLSSEKALPLDDDQEEVLENVAEFYTISGDDALHEESIELPDTLTDVEFNFEPDDEASVAETPASSSDSITPENNALPENRTVDNRDEPFTIPDHVLTPTLADIYYQQGQAHLALRIYERLLRHDPDNEKLVERMGEISAAIDRNELPESQTTEPVKITLPRQKRTTSRASRKKPVENDGPGQRPLAGIHLKKQVKNAAKKARTRKQ